MLATPTDAYSYGTPRHALMLALFRVVKGSRLASLVFAYLSAVQLAPPAHHLRENEGAKRFFKHANVFAHAFAAVQPSQYLLLSWYS
jgi:hypothetical protein